MERRGDYQLEGSITSSIKSNNRQANAWNSPADHFSILRTFMGAAWYVDRRAQLPRRRELWTTGDWKLLTRWSGDMQPITYNAGSSGAPRHSVCLRIATTASTAIWACSCRTSWWLGRVTLNLGPPLRPLHRRIARELCVAEPS